jgi:hypothetical protein
MWDAVRAWLEAGLDGPAPYALITPFLPELARPERGVSAVLLYGSCLWPSVRRADSEPDFLVVAEPAAWHRALGGRLLGAWLPPSVHRLRAGERCAKLSLISPAQLERATSPAAADAHVAGRLTKRVALVWARDPAARAALVDALLAALRLLSSLVLAELGERFPLDAFVAALLSVSYRAERRMLEPGKIDALFAAERAYYRGIARALLPALGAAPDGDDSFVRAAAPARPPAEVAAWLRRSRRRALLRWPKYLLTFDGWLDYALAKLARAGAPIGLSDRQRRHPLLLGWPALYRLFRDRVIQ